MARKAVKGNYVKNNSDGHLVVGELGLIWQPTGGPDDTQFVPEDVLDTSAPLQRMMNTLIAGTKVTILEVVEKGDYDKQIRESTAAAQQEYGSLLVTPRDEGIFYCSAKDDKGEPICRVYTSDPNVNRPYFCAAHEHLRDAPVVAPEGREKLEPQRHAMGPKADKPAVVPQHVLGGEAGSKLPTGMSLNDLEAQVEQFKGKG